VNEVAYITAHSSSRSTPSPVIPKHLTPLTPASAKKNKNKHSQSADDQTKQSAVRTNQRQEIWVRSPSPAVGSPSERLREKSPDSGSQGHRSRAAGQRSPSPAVGSVGQRSSRSNNGGSAVFSRRSASLSTVQRGTSPATTHVQQTSVVSGHFICYSFAKIEQNVFL